eukprot:TRINITY_DN31266_c0_g1_i1.p1 TRINITY_DN31266_c0_g1~~TRINITY_DN31266_c0_g1_i1.p1  ORF type:complete len:792 (-),score=151.59 TRINITY_DN31266_c0_g1_i1:74-2449(-)
MGNCQCPVVVSQIQNRDKFSNLDDIADCDTSTASEDDASNAESREGFLSEDHVKSHTLAEGEDSDVEDQLEEPPQVTRKRRGAVSSEPMQSAGYFREPFWNKHAAWEEQLKVTLRTCPVFRQYGDVELSKFVRAMEIHLRYGDQILAEQGEPGDGLFIVLEGTVCCHKVGSRAGEETLVATKKRGSLIDEASVLYSYPRPYAIRAQGECVLAKLSRKDYIDLGTRFQFYIREKYKMLLKGAKMLEMMTDEHLAQLADILQTRVYEAGKDIVKQGERGAEFYIMNSGVARVYVKTADDEQEYVRYHAGDLFGELALLKNAPRAAFVSAVTRVEVLVLSRRQFERLFGPMTDLKEQQYLRDPRKLIADFYDEGDSRGPRGSLRLKEMEPEADTYGRTTWFAVYRPTSKDAIAKMLSGNAVGKGLNVKGKSAKKGVLSGYVPFIQISDNEHRGLIEQSPSHSRVIIYFKTKAAREGARKLLQALMDDSKHLKIDYREIRDVDNYKPDVLGLDLPEPLIREAYIIKADLTPVMGWETGRRSEPAFMDMNMHAIRGQSDPQVCLFQYDESDPLNPRGLLIAYAEKYVKPVVSDFDTFTVGSRGMKYEALPSDQANMITWLLNNTREVLSSLDHNPWTSRWLDVLKRENAKGFHPSLPRFGFGDPTSYRLIGDVVAETSPCGAVRHGAECCNLYFPQELDEEYLVVWHGFPDKPWDYKDEPGCRQFLMSRVEDGHQFMLNPVWPVRDKGWFEVYAALGETEDGRSCLRSWFPPQAKYDEVVHQMRREFPEGFKIVQK